MTSPTTVERISDREIIATRTLAAPVPLVFDAWTKPDLIMRWWAPASFGIAFLSCETDVRTGGGYRYVFSHPDLAEPMAFFGRYIEVAPPSRLVWTNEEAADGAVTTVTFDAQEGRTRVVVHDLYPTREALDAAISSGGTGAWPEQFEALEELLAPSNPSP